MYLYVLHQPVEYSKVSLLCVGSGQVVLRPQTTAQVSEVIRYCNQGRLAVVPQGGNTGLVGGSVPVFDEVIISTQLMNNIISIDPVAGE